MASRPMPSCAAPAAHVAGPSLIAAGRVMMPPSPGTTMKASPVTVEGGAPAVAERRGRLAFAQG